MNRQRQSILYLFLVVLSLYVSSCTPVTNTLPEPPPPTRFRPPPAVLPEYTVCRTDTGIRIDGMIGDPDWQNAHPMRFVIPWNNVVQEGRQDTVSRLLWDDTYLYIIYQCDDPYLHATVMQHDGPVYQEDAVEFFATPNANNIKAYYGFEMNLHGTMLDYIAFGGGKAWTANIHPGLAERRGANREHLQWYSQCSRRYRPGLDSRNRDSPREFSPPRRPDSPATRRPMARRPQSDGWL